MNKIFGIGLPKTGTSSLNESLKILGFRSRHNPLDLRALSYNYGVYQYARDDWDALTNFGEHFYPQLDRNYPQSKFILTIRDKDAWLSSAGKWFSRPQENPPIDDKCCLETFGCVRFQYERFSYVYDLHRKNAEGYFRNRPGDLLILDCSRSDAWRKLCEHLGQPVPDRPFPHLKEGESPRNSVCRRMGNRLINMVTGRY